MLSFVMQDLTQHIHHTSWHIRNDSQLLLIVLILQHASTVVPGSRVSYKPCIWNGKPFKNRLQWI